MLSLGWGEIFLIAVLALVVVGPKHLPEVAKTLGKTWGGLKRAFEESTREIRTELRELDNDIARTAAEARATAKDAVATPVKTKPDAPPSQDEVTADGDLAEFVGEVTGKQDGKGSSQQS